MYDTLIGSAQIVRHNRYLIHYTHYSNTIIILCYYTRVKQTLVEYMYSITINTHRLLNKIEERKEVNCN